MNTIFSCITFCFLSISMLSADQTSAYLEENAFSRIAEVAMPATVFIKVEASAPAQEALVNPFDLFRDEFFRHHFGAPMDPAPSQPKITAGSGFIISSDGYIVTNHHVIKDATKITVVLADETEEIAVVKGSDSSTDLAVLKIEKTNLPHLTFGNSDELKVGQWIAAIGSPFGIGATLTKGIVSAKGRQDVGVASYEDFIQTDAAINPGNSGGPLLNLQAQVIGVNTAIFTRSGGYMGIGFAIPSSMTERVIGQIIQHGHVTRAYLGITMQPLNLQLSEALGIDPQEGILVSNVLADSPAQKGGLEQGDVILEYNKKPVKSITAFRNDLVMMNPDTAIHLKIVRNNKPKELSIVLGTQNAQAISRGMIEKIGLEVENITPEMRTRFGFPADAQGVVVTKVKQGSPAARSGIRPGGFLITGVVIRGGKEIQVQNVSDFEKALQELGDKKNFALVVRHQDYRYYYSIQLK